MSLFLIFCVLAAAAWLLLSLTNRGSSDRPDASVAAYSRAMEALSPEHEHPAARRPTRRRPPSRSTRPRQRTAAPASRRSASAARTTTRR